MLQAHADKILADHGFPWRKIKIDGVNGPLSLKAYAFAAFCIGLSPAQIRNIKDGKITQHAQQYLRREKARNSEMKGRDEERTEEIRRLRKLHESPDPDGDGLGLFDGVVVDAEFITWLKRARAHGWKGEVISGFRDPLYSEGLCMAMCGAPTCPGKCAGKGSRHSQKWGNGAVDVTDYYTLGRIFAEMGAPFKNSLGPADPVHFSKAGN